MDFEKVFPELCTNGRYQRLIYLLVLLPAQLPLYVHLFSHLFFTYQPPHWCKADHLLAAFASTSSSTTSSSSPTSPTSTSSSSSFSALNSSSSSSSSSTSELLGQSLQSNEAMRRFFFTPSTFVVRSWTSDNHLHLQQQQQQRGLLNLSQIAEAVNHSLLQYVQHSLDACSLYNASQEELVRFHQRFLALFAQLTPSPPSSSSPASSSNDHHHNANIASSAEMSSTLLLPSPPIAACSSSGWSFNETWLGGAGGDQSIVTKWNLVCQHEWLQLVPLAALLLGLLCGYPLYYLLRRSIGYRRTYFVLLVAQCSAGTVSALVADLAHFSLLRFVIGLSLPTAAVLPSDLMVESAGVRVIGPTVLAGEVVRLAGALVAGGLVALHITDYRHLSVALSLPFLVFAFLWWSFPESPSYLLVSGQIARLEKLVLDIAHTNFPRQRRGGSKESNGTGSRHAFELEPSFDESIKRRIYTELAIYRELMISSLMHDSLGRRLDSYINRGGSNSSNNNSSSNSNSNSSSAGNSIAGVPKEFIDFTGAHREATTLMMMKSLSPGRRKEQARSSAEDELETTEFKEQEVVIKSSSSSNNSPSTLIKKLSQHLEGKEEPVQALAIPAIPNGKIATVTTTTSSPQPEIWSEAESETDGSSSSVPKLPTPSKRRTISSPRLLAAPKISGPPRPLSSPTPANFLPRASVASSASKTSSPSASIGNGHISSSSSSGAVPSAFPVDPKKSTFSFPPKHTTTTTLLTILRLPNMRRKCLVLFFLSATHTTLYVAFTYFVADFTTAFSKESSLGSHHLHHLFSLSICLNLVAVALVWAFTIRLHFGRKCTFLLANLLASVFTLCTGFSMSAKDVSDDNQQNDSISSSSSTSSSTFYHQHLKHYHHHLLPLLLYSLAKIFQSSTYLILLIWLYELLPPSADCSAALKAAFTVAHLSLAVLAPLLLFAAQKSLKLSILLPGHLVEQLSSSGRGSSSKQLLWSLPLHYLTAALLLSVCGLLCLLLPETGAFTSEQQHQQRRRRLPCSLQEAELFGAHQGEPPGTSRRWYSLRALFSFRPPNILPASGILKKGNGGSSSTASNCNGVKHCGAAPQLKSAGVDQQLKKRGAPPFLFDAALEAKLASLSKEAANQTAINSLYNQFMGISGNAAIISNAANSATATVGRDFGSGGGGGNRRSFESGSSNFSSSHHRRSPSNERHQSASWMSAVADAAATGVPLFVPVPSPTHIGGNAIGGQGAKLGAGGGGAGNVASYEQYSHHHHQQQYYQNQNHSQQALLSHKSSSAFQPISNRRHSMQQQQQQNDPSGHHHYQQQLNYQQQQHQQLQQQQQHYSAKDLKMMGSHSDLHFTGTVIDLPDGSGKSIAGGDLSQLQQLYPQQKTAQYHSLPRGQSINSGGSGHHSHQPNQQQHLWSSTTGEHHLPSDHQLARWLDSHGLVWSAAPAAPADSGGHFSRGGGGGPAAAVRVLDIIDTNNGGLSSGQIDAYGLMEANNSTAAAAAAFTAADFSTLLDDDGGGGLHFDGTGLEPVAFIPLDI